MQCLYVAENMTKCPLTRGVRLREVDIQRGEKIRRCNNPTVLPDIRIISANVEFGPRVKVLFRPGDRCHDTLIVHAQSPPF